MPAQVLRPVEIDEKELRGVAKAGTFQEVPVGLRKTRGLPSAQKRAPFAESRVLGEPGAQVHRAVELSKQQVVEPLFQHIHILYGKGGFDRLNAHAGASCVDENALWWGNVREESNEPA